MSNILVKQHTTHHADGSLTVTTWALTDSGIICDDQDMGDGWQGEIRAAPERVETWMRENGETVYIRDGYREGYNGEVEMVDLDPTPLPKSLR